MSNRLGGKQGTSYLGTNANQPPNWNFEDRDPNQYDINNISLGDLWLNKTNESVWVLVSLAGDMESKGSLATWQRLEISGGGGSGLLDTLTGATGGAILPDVNSNINLASAITGLTFAGNAGTNTLTLTSTGGVGDVVQSVTGNSGGAVGALLGNINIVGDGVGINITGNPGTHTLTASLVGGSGDEAVEKFDTDSGSVLPTAGLVNITTGYSSQQAGSTVLFSGSTDTIKLNISDTNDNTIIGKGSGNATLSGQNNAIVGSFSGNSLTSGSSNSFFGSFCGPDITSGSDNTVVGDNALGSLVTGTKNIIIGSASGSSYTSSESNNILIGYINSGVVGDANTLRVGESTGTGNGELNKSFIQGIRGVAPDAADGIAVYIDSLGQLGTVGTSGPTISFNTDSGTASPSAGVVIIKADQSTQNAGSSVSFNGSGTNIVQFNVTDVAQNTIIGKGSGNATLAATNNTINGASSASSLTSGSGNTIVGRLSATAMTTGALNTIIGGNNSNAITSGSRNVIIGSTSGSVFSTGSNNIIIGANSTGVSNTSNSLRIGSGTGTGNGQLNQTFIHGIRGVTPGAGNAIPVVIDSTGQLGTEGSGGSAAAFFAYLNLSVTNVTGNGTTYSILFDTTVFNRDTAFNPATSIFTAPVTGLYNFSCGVQYLNIQGTANTNGLINIITTNNSFVVFNANYSTVAIGTSGTDPAVRSLSAGNNVYANMDAGDTAFIRTTVSGSSQLVTTIVGKSQGFGLGTFFGGQLV